MANGDRPPVSLIDRGPMGLNDEELEAVEVESIVNNLETEALPEGIAGLFEDMMGPGTVDETERVYEYPGGTMTERVSRGCCNLRTG